MARRNRRPGLHQRAPSPRRSLVLRLTVLFVVAGAAAVGADVAGAFSGGSHAPHGHRRAHGSTRLATGHAGARGPSATAATATRASAHATTSPLLPTTSAPGSSATSTPAAPSTSAPPSSLPPVTTTLPPPLPPPSSVLVEVLNGSGVARQATKAAAALRRAGFVINGTGNASSFLYKDTLVLYAPGGEPAAEVLAARILGATDVEASSKVPAGVVDLVLGDSYEGVTPG